MEPDMAEMPNGFPARPTSYDKKVGLVLQGGGALGSYQAGVYEALASSEYLPDWVAGISIGAINAAIIAGNQPDDRLKHLRAFLERDHQPYQFLAGWTRLAVCRLAAAGKRIDGGYVRPTRIFRSAPSVRLVFTEKADQLLRYVGSQKHAGTFGRFRTDQ
jgi:predicted acylesterase/phospholipase RssA